MTATERFLKYVTFDTRSDEASGTHPSSAKQKLLGEYLASELKAIGAENAHMDSLSYVYGFIPASKGLEGAPKIGLIAHMDTSPDVSGEGVNPQLIEYNGGDINLKNGEKIELSTFPDLKQLNGERLIVTDGNTLLGADDKAGIAEIFTAAEHIIAHPEIRHGKISICITPDEEIGEGADNFDLEKFDADFAFTVDGGRLGEINYENFNAASAEIKLNGINIHPGAAKNKMKNAVLLACELISLLPAAEAPSHTEGYEGFYHASDISGNESECRISMLIRDHSAEKFEARKQQLKNICSYLNSTHGEGSVELKIKDSYRNMKEKIEPVMHIIERAKNAFIACGIEPFEAAIRGGTDGAQLTFKGLPCPNLSTGGMNFHSIHELIPEAALDKMSEVLINILTNIIK